MSAKPGRPPGNLSHLQRLANAAAADAQMPPGRYQRWVNTHIISAVLDPGREAEVDWGQAEVELARDRDDGAGFRDARGSRRGVLLGVAGRDSSERFGALWDAPPVQQA